MFLLIVVKTTRFFFVTQRPGIEAGRYQVRDKMVNGFGTFAFHFPILYISCSPFPSLQSRYLLDCEMSICYYLALDVGALESGLPGFFFKSVFQFQARIINLQQFCSGITPNRNYNQDIPIRITNCDSSLQKRRLTFG